MLNKADAHGTRNLHPAIFKTNDTAPYQLTNESYLHLMSKKVAPRRVKQRSSTSNSHSKPKHNKSTTAYVLNVKSSSRTNSTYKGCLYKTFHQEGKNQAESHVEWVSKDPVVISKPSKPTHKSRKRGLSNFKVKGISRRKSSITGSHLQQRC